MVVERLKKAYAQVPIGDPLDGESRDFVVTRRWSCDLVMCRGRAVWASS